MVARIWDWYQRLAGRDRLLATSFLAIILGTLPCYAFGVALLFAAPGSSGAASPAGEAAAPPAIPAHPSLGPTPVGSLVPASGAALPAAGPPTVTAATPPAASEPLPTASPHPAVSHPPPTGARPTGLGPGPA